MTTPRKESTRKEGSRHHAGGSRFHLPTAQVGILEGVKCKGCGKEQIAAVPTMPLTCLNCGKEHP